MRIKIDLFLVFLVFLAFKLAGIIAWSWWWVCSPLLLYPVILLAALILIMFGLLVSTDKTVSKLIKEIESAKKKKKW